MRTAQVCPPHKKVKDSKTDRGLPELDEWCHIQGKGLMRKRDSGRHTDAYQSDWTIIVMHKGLALSNQSGLKLSTNQRKSLNPGLSVPNCNATNEWTAG